MLSRNISNIKGEVSVYVGFKNKSTGKEIYKNFILKGLARNPVGADHNGRLSGDPLAAYWWPTRISWLS
nr:hypothetical protein [Mycoplasmopsis bovis]